MSVLRLLHIHIGRVNISQQLYSWRVKHFDIDRCANNNILHDPFKVNFLYPHYDSHLRTTAEKALA
jgi:hypothetical protein